MSNLIDITIAPDGSLTVTGNAPVVDVTVDAPGEVTVTTTGPPGPAGINASIVDGTWVYDTSTVMADPGSGRVRSSADRTQAAIAHDDVDRRDLTRVINALTTQDVIVMQAEANAQVWGRYRVTSVTDMGTWTLLGLSAVSSQGTLVKNQRIFVRFVLDSGATSNISHSALLDLDSDDHTQYGLVVIAPSRPANPRPGTIWCIDT